MMSNGFIIAGNWCESIGDDGISTDLHVKDLRVEDVEDDDLIISVSISEAQASIDLTLPEAKAFVEAVQEIIDRYPTQGA